MIDWSALVVITVICWILGFITESVYKLLKGRSDDNKSLNTANECLRAQIKYLHGKLSKIQDIAEYTEEIEAEDD
jgi:Mg2+/Co2+ transporter CorB